MYIIVDGYNLLKTYYHSALEEDRDELVKTLEGYRKSKFCKLTVVFDGYNNRSGSNNREQKAGGTKIIYSPSGISADRKIVDLVRHLGRGVIVVSSDRELRKAVERLGSFTITSEDFIQRLMGSEKDCYDFEEFPEKNVKKIKKGVGLKERVLKKL